MTTVLSNLNRLNFFSLEDFLVNLQLKSHRTLHLLLYYLETLMSAKQAINGKLQGSVATYIRCAGVVNKQIKKGLLLILSVNFF